MYDFLGAPSGRSIDVGLGVVIWGSEPRVNVAVGIHENDNAK